MIDVLSSGSSGNSYLLSDDKVAVFLDAGVNKKSLLSVINKTIGKKCYLFITHEHFDHIKGLKYFQKNLDIEIFCSFGTAKYLYQSAYDTKDIKVIHPKNKYLFNNFSVIPFNVFHDGQDTFGYRFSINNKDISFVTDTGIIDKMILDVIDGSNVVFIETNYDENMLKKGSYPMHLKKRILSKHGHLSNNEAIKTLHEIYGRQLTDVFFSHISEENNSYTLLDKYVTYVENTLKTKAYVLRQRTHYTFSL
jgi:phosphoribosyl 1,2-cyclic phosphodiesterase